MNDFLDGHYYPPLPCPPPGRSRYQEILEKVMTTTAFDDQFVAGTQTIERIREHLSRESILRWNIAALEVALRTQTSRAEAAEAELAKAREQTPVGWMREDGNLYLAWQKDLCLPEVRFSPLYAAPVPTPAVPYGVDEEAANRIALAVYDCKHGINKEPLLYAINRILVTEAHPLSAEGQRALLQSAEVRHD